MSESKNPNAIRSRIWQEDAEPGNPFAARAAYCAGFDVYGAMLGNSRWTDMLFLLFRGDPPSAAQASLLETLAVALANPGPRDPSVHAAMCGGTCGAPAAASLMAALAVGAGGLGGGHDVLLAMQAWGHAGDDLAAWQRLFAHDADGVASIWLRPEHPAGFDPNGVAAATIVLQTLECLAGIGVGTHLRFLARERSALEQASGLPLAMSGVAAAAFADLGFTPEQGEMLYLLLRLPGAAAHALEQRALGHKQFPFFSLDYVDPANGGQA